MKLTTTEEVLVYFHGGSYNGEVEPIWVEIGPKGIELPPWLEVGTGSGKEQYQKTKQTASVTVEKTNTTRTAFVYKFLAHIL